MDVSQYLEIFLDETNEHLQSLNTQILNLEQNPEDSDTINEIFRAAHSLKGMAGTMGYKRMQNLTHDMENVFSEVRNGSIKVNASMIDVLFQCLDALEEYLVLFDGKFAELSVRLDSVLLTLFARALVSSPISRYLELQMPLIVTREFMLVSACANRFSVEELCGNGNATRLDAQRIRSVEYRAQVLAFPEAELVAHEP